MRDHLVWAPDHDADLRSLAFPLYYKVGTRFSGLVFNPAPWIGPGEPPPCFISIAVNMYLAVEVIRYSDNKIDISANSYISPSLGMPPPANTRDMRHDGYMGQSTIVPSVPKIITGSWSTDAKLDWKGMSVNGQKANINVSFEAKYIVKRSGDTCMNKLFGTGYIFREVPPFRSGDTLLSRRLDADGQPLPITLAAYRRRRSRPEA
jgi:hypothetical protein